MSNNNFLRFAAYVVLLGLSTRFTQGCEAQDSWQASSAAAHSFELRDDYKQAATSYRHALTLLPARNENEKAKITSSLAVDFLKLKQFNKGMEAGEAALKIVQNLNKQSRLEPDVLLNIKILIDTGVLNQGLTVPLATRQILGQKFGELPFSLRQALNPKDPALVTERINWTRTYVARGHDDQAERALSQILAELKPSSDQYWQVKLSIAGLQGKQGKMELTRQLERQLRKRYSEAEVLRQVAEGQFWAGNHAGARATLALAQSKLGKEKGDTVHEQIKIESLYASTYMDCLDHKTAEVHMRKVVALLSKDPADEQDLRDAKSNLAFCLREQHRLKEAALVDPHKHTSGWPEYEFILNEKEKAALQKMQPKGGSR